VNRQNAIILGVAIFIGLIAVYLANSYFSGYDAQQQAQLKQTRLVKIAVAAQPVQFAQPLTNGNVVLADWPAASVPAGAFSSLPDAINNRVALRPLAAGEPILSSLVSGTNGRATLSTTLPDGKLAVSVPVSEVSGVAGFVRPGDAVDVLLTRQIPGDAARGNDKMTDVLMEAVPVLAIDQVADSSKTDPSPARTATLEVDSYGAQRLALARELGTLSLALRNVASQALGPVRTVTARDLTAGRVYTGPRLAQAAVAPRPQPPRIQSAVAPMAPVYRGPKMTIYRKAAPTEYEVRGES
jgi:pilus assembly protein CpaB